MIKVIVQSLQVACVQEAEHVEKSLEDLGQFQRQERSG